MFAYGANAGQDSRLILEIQIDYSEKERSVDGA